MPLRMVSLAEQPNICAHLRARGIDRQQAQISQFGAGPPRAAGRFGRARVKAIFGVARDSFASLVPEPAPTGLGGGGEVCWGIGAVRREAGVVVSFAPLAPPSYVPPSKIAADTWVIHQVQPALGQPLFVYFNSMVIVGAEPVIIDTGTPANRQQWLSDAFSLVDPQDVRWVFLSHDDVDHSGNLDEVMTACPNATLVCNWAMLERNTCCFDFPLGRCRWVMDGESLDIGDRQLLAVRPPVFDSPTTRGLFDPATGVYWAVDTFATPLPDPHLGVGDLDPDFWREALALFAFGAVSPWLSMVDLDKYGRCVDRVQSLDISTVACCHSPVIEGPLIERAFAHVRQLPALGPPPLPGQSVLDQVIAATSQPRT